MERLFIREKQLEYPKGITNKRIGVVGLGQNVGTTLVATALAFFFAENGEKVNFTECANLAKVNTLIYDAVAMDKRFANRTFNDIYQAILEQRPYGDKLNLEKKVNWVLATPDNCEKKIELTMEEKSRLMLGGKGGINIFDFSEDLSWEPFFLDMDEIFVIVDPLPSKMIRHCNKFTRLRKLELNGCKINWVINKVNDGVNMRQVKGYLKTNKVMVIPMFNPYLIYADEYGCKFHWENKEIKSKLWEIFISYLKVGRNIV